MTPEDIFSTFLRVLNEAHEADPYALHNLASGRYVCNQTLADHPFIQVTAVSNADGNDEQYVVGLLGIINGICEPLTGRRIAAKFSEPDSGQKSQLLGFVEYKPTSPTMSAIGITAPQKTKDPQ
jgi:hypothetical protein